MRNLGKVFLIVFIAVSVLSFACDSYAQAPQEQGTWAKMGDKLKRGIANTFTGWWEIVVNTAKDKKTTSWWWVTGPVKGLGYGLVRTGVGIYEGVTFILPLPPDYGVIMEPRLAWEQDY